MYGYHFKFLSNDLRVTSNVSMTWKSSGDLSSTTSAVPDSALQRFFLGGRSVDVRFPMPYVALVTTSSLTVDRHSGGGSSLREM